VRAELVGEVGQGAGGQRDGGRIGQQAELPGRQSFLVDRCPTGSFVLCGRMTRASDQSVTRAARWVNTAGTMTG
jgi:hypothetical protein